jgi:transcriptional regulator with XRE-family HTH domain
MRVQVVLTTLVVLAVNLLLGVGIPLGGMKVPGHHNKNQAQKAIHVDDPAAVGRRVLDARRSSGLTLREVAFEGCTAAYLSQIEHGRRTPSLQVIVELGRRLGVDPQYLANGVSTGAGARRPESAIDIYRRALGIAQTRDERLWVLVGLAQAAAVVGDLDLTRDSLQRALSLIGPEP